MYFIVVDRENIEVCMQFLELLGRIHSSHEILLLCCVGKMYFIVVD